MEISLKNFEKVLSKELLRHAAKCTVRECDETEKGHFVAYVDEGEGSFDVSLVISPTRNIVEHHCDCKQEDHFCRHRAALLLHVAGGKKVKATVKGNKKERQAELLLGETDPADLKAWVGELLAKNKDLELAFIHHFSAREQQYSPEDATRLTQEAIKAVVKTKRNIDLTQLKKIVDLWEEVHAPIVRSYLANVADEAAFLAFHALLDSCLDFHLQTRTTSNKIPRYVEDLLQRAAGPLNDLETAEAWQAATGYFIRHVPVGDNWVRLHYLQHLKALAAISTPERKASLVERLVAQYAKIRTDYLADEVKYTRLLLDLVEESGAFDRYHSLFKPLYYENEYNGKLIGLLVQHHHLGEAAKYCRQQIERNSRDEYNTAYLELLKVIYTLQGDEEALAWVLEKLFPRTFSFEDFLFIYSRLPEGEEKKKWRAKILAKARNVTGYNRAASVFCFRLMDYEQSYKKMIGCINSSAPYPVILQYLDPMAAANKAELLKTLLYKSDDHFWGPLYEEAAKDKECFPALQEALLKHYTAGELKAVLRQTESQKYFYRLNDLFQYLKQHLPAEAR